MADIDMRYTTDTGAGTVGAGNMAPYVLNRKITLAELTAEKGSAPAASDAIVLWSLPAGATVLSASLNVSTAFNAATACTLDYGLGTADVDRFVDGYDATSAGVAAQVSIAGTAAEPAQPFPSVLTAADTVEVLFASLSGAMTTGALTAQIVVAPAPAERKGGSARDG